MGLLDRFEAKLDGLVNGAFARAFKAEVQPVEIAAALQREIDDRAAVVARGRTVIPNVFTVELSPHDHERLSVYSQALAGELAGMVQEYAQEQRYTFLGSVSVALAEDDELETGIFRVRSEARAEVSAQPVPGGAPLSGLADISGHARLEADGAAYPLVRAVTRLGRGTDVDIRVDDPGVSRTHCEIVLGTPAIVRDLGSTNGTYVDGSRVGQAALVDGSRVQLGSTTLVYRSG